MLLGEKNLIINLWILMFYEKKVELKSVIIGKVLEII